MSKPAAAAFRRSAGVTASPRRATNVALPAALLREARSLGVNLSQACELALAVATTRRQQWLEENRAAIEASNAFVERHGLPLAGFRQF